MKHTNIDLEYLFNNIKNGDFLAFYHNPWYFLFSKLIRFFTGLRIDHIAGVFNIIRSENMVIFKMGEMKITGGRVINTYTITREKQGNKFKYIIDSRFRKSYIDFYYIPNTHTITKEQNAKLEEFWGKDAEYNVVETILSLNWVYKIYSFLSFKKKKKYANICSSACKQSMEYINIFCKKFNDPIPSPADFLKYNYIQELFLVKIKYQNMPKQVKRTKLYGTTAFILVLYIIWTIMPRNFEYMYFTENKKVRDAMIDKVEQCGKGYYASWLKFESLEHKGNYYFQDVVGCSSCEGDKKHCGYSVKEKGLNPHYSRRDLVIKSTLYGYLQQIPSGSVGYYIRAELEKMSNEYYEINDILNTTNNVILAAGVVVIKNTHNRITDIFIITQTQQNLTICNKQDITKILQELSSLIDVRD